MRGSSTEPGGVGRAGRGWDALPEVRKGSGRTGGIGSHPQEGREDWEAFLEVWERSGDPSGWLGVLEALPTGVGRFGSPTLGPGGVTRPSWRAGRGQWPFWKAGRGREGRESWEFLPEGREELGDLLGR